MASLTPLPLCLERLSSSAGLEQTLQADLEYGPLLPEAALRPLHLARERARLQRVLAAGGFGHVGATGVSLVRPLDFDSAHFGFPCADLLRLYVGPGAPVEEQAALLDRTIDEARRRGIRLLSARLPAACIAATNHLLRRGFLLVDTSVELGTTRPLVTGPAAAAVQVREPAPGDEEALRQLARTFVDNRFHRDPALPRHLATALYAEWVSRAMRGEHGRLLVATLDGALAGFSTYAVADEALGVKVLGLVVVAPACRGVGLLGPLLGACAERLPGRAVTTSTQVANAAALRSFGRLGLLPYGARQIFHGWL